MHRGVAGTQKLNHDLQQMLNPRQLTGAMQSIGVFSSAFQIGDRVMQLRNNYDKHVFNGDIGIIETIDMRRSNYAGTFF